VELLCALLTGFFLWLFFYHWHHAAVARARELGGGLLIKVKAARQISHKPRVARACATATILLMFLLMLYMQCWVSPTPRSFSDDFIIGCFLFSLFQVAFPPFRRDAPLELRERGVLRRKQSYENSPGRLAFTPWDEIAACKWCEVLPQHYVHTRHLLLESGDLPREDIETITKIVGRLVPVCDAEGRLMAMPESDDKTPRAVAGKRSSGGLRFQFNLQSLLLLMVVVSCAASCYGMHYRRLQPQRAAVAQFDKFHPHVYERGDDVWWVDFSACPVKPGDDDLAHLEQLRNIEHLDLDGAPITDAGLKHLYSLKKLKTVMLSNTQITQRGMDDLKRALPNANLVSSPPPPPAPRPPLVGK
jgi:hypothetical protein